MSDSKEESKEDKATRKREALRRLNSQRFKDESKAEMKVEVSIASVRQNSLVVAEKISIRRAPSVSVSTSTSSTAAVVRKVSAGGEHITIRNQKDPLATADADDFSSQRRKPLVYLAADLESPSSESNTLSRRKDIETDIETTHATSEPANIDTRLYLSPPEDPKGTSISLSDRQLLCASVSRDKTEIVIGCADHAAYSVKFTSNFKRHSVKQLYSTKFGHSEWVTSVAFTSDNRVVTTGMDGKLCLWDANRSSCVEIRSHFGSITKAIADANTNVGFSAGYDGKIYSYSFGEASKQKGSSVLRSTHCFQGHKAPVMDIEYFESTLCSGARDGDVYFWDVGVGAVSKRYHGHKDSVTRVIALDAHTCVTAGIDGCVKLFDAREKTCVVNVLVSASADKGTAAVGCLAHIPQGRGDHGLVIAGSADGSITVLDLRTVRGIVQRWNHYKSPVYTVAPLGAECFFSGGGDGMLLCYDLKSASGLKYGLCGSENGAVQCVFHMGEGSIAAVGESGNLLMYKYQ